MSHQNLTSNLAIDGPHDEIKELALSFNQLIARLDHAFSSQKQFNGSVAHELKTPLAIARTNIEALEEQECVTTQQYQDTLAMIKQSMIGMNQVVEALLDLAQHDNAPLNDCVQLEDLLEDLLEDMSPLADARQITITTEIAPNLPPLAGNQILLYRGISNIIENSIKYNHDQGKINLACWVEESKISILISDTGKGIAPEHIGHIFEPFYRAEGVNIRSLDGIGLGLAMSKSTIELHGGTITMESLIDCGTTVTITLPTTPCPNC